MERHYGRRERSSSLLARSVTLGADVLMDQFDARSILDPRVADLVDSVARAVRERARREAEAHRRRAEAIKNNRLRILDNVRAVLREAENRRSQLRDRLANRKAELAQLERTYVAEFEALRKLLRQRHREYRSRIESARRSYQQAVWESSTLHEALKSGVQSDLTSYGACLDELADRAKAARQRAIEIAANWGISSLDVTPYVAEPAATAAELRTGIETIVTEIEESVARAENTPTLGGRGVLAAGLAAFAATAGTLGYGIASGNPVLFGLLSLGTGPIAGGLVALGTYLWNRHRLRALLSSVLGRADWVVSNARACKKMLAIEGLQRVRKDRERHRSEVRRLKDQLGENLDSARRALQESRGEILNVRLVKLRTLQQKLENARSEQDAFRRDEEEALRRWRREQLMQVRRQAREDERRVEQQFHHEIDQAADRFDQTLEQLHRTAQALWQEVRRRFPRWEELGAEWQPPDTVLSYMPVGTLEVHVERISGFSSDWHVPPESRTLALPALLPVPVPHALLVSPENEPAGMAASPLDWFASIAARFLMALPPSQARLLLLDPVNLGAPFGGFMHLSDFDRRLIYQRIWTVRSDVEQQLRLLFEEMETILQSCLRNEYADLDRYNQAAGEMAEPFRLAVLTDYPDGLSEPVLEQLETMVQNARRCGVSVLLLEGRQTRTETKSHVFPVRLQRNGRIPLNCSGVPLELVPEEGPPADVLTRLVRVVGEFAVERGKVEVPLEKVLPPAGRWWQASSAEGLSIPLGVRAANAVQQLRLGAGTAQHVLVAGRTGSGKSNLLHVLIVSACLNYSPRELQLYLVDFKKGVEFKPYAEHELPHARVVAIESEREFGLSVLRQLDQEMQRRGELFRAAAVQDLPTYRRKCPGETIPRVLLIIDEFQEFFVEEDDIARDAAQLLDRLVRQGRAFGIHVLLGSQTLSGTYALPRSTITQMGVRIALQCSESDAHLILGEDNPAARLLSRPGDAIYNDTNGLREGNQRFQIAFLPLAEREAYLRQISELAKTHGVRRDRELVVFEGNVPADLLKNRPFRALLDGGNWPGRLEELKLWPGESVALPEPVTAHLAPEAAANLLIVGQDGELANGMMLSFLLQAAAQVTPVNGKDLPPFVYLDGLPSERSPREQWQRLAERLPHGLQCATRRDLDSVLTMLSTELDRRLSSASDDYQPMLLFVYDLGQLRTLQYADELFGFGGPTDSSPQAVSPSRLWQRLLREGPTVGIHAVVWCDSPADVWRMLTRTLLREFAWRIALQMNVNDSTSLLDTPAAGRLGPNRAILYAEQTGSHARFRPYRAPDKAEIDRICAQISRFRTDVRAPGVG